MASKRARRRPGAASSSNRVGLEIDSQTIQTGVGDALAYVVVDRESGYCWGTTVCEPDDVGEVVASLEKAVAKVRRELSPSGIIELRHDGAAVFGSAAFTEAVEKLGLARTWKRDGLDVDVAERALWQMRTHFHELAHQLADEFDDEFDE